MGNVLNSYRVKQRAKYIMGPNTDDRYRLYPCPCPTLLHRACGGGFDVVVEMLLQIDVNTEEKNSDGYTPLHLACQIGYVEIVVLLLDAGADIEATTYEMYTPLHIACGYDKADIVKILLERGANINAKNTRVKNRTPLDMCNYEIKKIIHNHLLRKELNTNFEQHVPAVVDLCCDYVS